MGADGEVGRPGPERDRAEYEREVRELEAQWSMPPYRAKLKASPAPKKDDGPKKAGDQLKGGLE